MSYGNTISLEVKEQCCQMHAGGKLAKEIYDEYFRGLFKNPCSFESFRVQLGRWKKKNNFADPETLERGTYEGFIAHDATVQISGSGEITQAWIKQKADEIDVDQFLSALDEKVEKYEFVSSTSKNFSRMLEIPLFDMHWGVAFMDYYEPVLNEVLELIHNGCWDEIVIPFGQDFFHNDSIVNGKTTKGTDIEKVDMVRAVKEGQKFMYAIIDSAISNSNKTRVLYSSGNHDRSISWMFMQVLLERYGSRVVDDSLDYRKVITYGKNSIMITHGDSRQATPTNLAPIFSISFPKEFAEANIREVHAGHLHSEKESDVHGVMVRRLSSGNKLDDWSDREDYVGTNKRFMLFEWDEKKLRSIHYI